MTKDARGESQRTLRGLLVDDKTVFSLDASKFLEDRFKELREHPILIRISQCNSPEDAVSMIRNSSARPPFDLVLTDMMYPPVGRPEAPFEEHVQRGTDIMRAALDAGVPAVIGFTLLGTPRFQELRGRCRDLGAELYQQGDLIAAEEDSVVGEIARKLLKSSEPQDVAVICSTNAKVRRAILRFLRSLGLHPLEFDQAVGWAEGGPPPAQHVIAKLFREVQAVLVLFTPDMRVAPSSGAAGHRRTPEQMFWPDSHVLIQAGMALFANPARTIFMRLGRVNHSCAYYTECLEIDDSADRQHALAQRLEQVGCRVRRVESLDVVPGFDAAVVAGQEEDTGPGPDAWFS
jgi:CheY-like chemotaxis protein